MAQGQDYGPLLSKAASASLPGPLSTPHTKDDERGKLPHLPSCHLSGEADSSGQSGLKTLDWAEG